jgi:hypothetical protein
MKALSILTGIAAFYAAFGPSPCSAQPAEPAAPKAESTTKIDINTAEIPVLEAIPEIGTNFANAVVAARPFKSVFELQSILKISGEKMVELHGKVTASPPRIPSPLAVKASAPPLSSTPGTEAPASGPSPALVADQERAEARRRHIRREGPIVAVPPPSPRVETKLAAPGNNYVWKPGHWTPVQGEWQWTPGEWAVPPTPISVWIEGTYDGKTRRWSPGYWEPDTIQLSER